MLFLFLAIITIYAFFHEGGHLLVGLLSGSRVTAFDISFPGAYVAMDGNLTLTQSILSSFAGIGLTYLACLAFLLLAPIAVGPVVSLAKLLATVMLLSTLLVWIIFPFLYLAGSAPSDDATTFLARSGLPPLLAAALALALFAIGAAVYLRRSGDRRALLASFRDPRVSWLTPAARRPLATLAVLLVAVYATSFALNGFRIGTGASSPFWPPSDDRRAVDFNLAADADRADEPVYAFTLDQPHEVDLLFVLKDVRADVLSVRVAGSNGYTKSLFTAKGYTASVDSAALNEILPPGKYQILLSTSEAAGHIAISVKQ